MSGAEEILQIRIIISHFFVRQWLIRWVNSDYAVYDVTIAALSLLLSLKEVDCPVNINQLLMKNDLFYYT